MKFYRLGELVRDTFREFGRVWRRLLLVSLPVIGLVWVIDFFTDWLRQSAPKISPLLGQFGTLMIIRSPGYNEFKNKAILITLLTLISVVVDTIGYLALIITFRDRKKPFKLSTSYLEAARWLVPAVLTGVMVWLLKIGAFWLLWLPAIIFGVWFSLARFAVVYRHQWGNRSLMISRELIRGHGLTVWLFYFAAAAAVWLISIPQILILLRIARISSQNLNFLWGGRIFFLIPRVLSWVVLIFNALIYERLSAIKPKLSLKKSYKYWLVALVGYLLIGVLGFAAIKTGALEKWFNRVFPVDANYYNYPSPGYTLEEYKQKLKDEEADWELIKAGKKQIVDNGLPLYFPSKFNPEIKSDFELVFNKVRAFFLQYGEYPDSLNQLSPQYFADKAPLNQLTGTPFNYHPRADRVGKNIGFTLCPKIEDPLEYCYRQ